MQIEPPFEENEEESKESEFWKDVYKRQAKDKAKQLNAARDKVKKMDRGREI